MFFVYFLICLRSRHSYVGHTDNLVRRFRMHRDGRTITTRNRLTEPIMVYWEAHSTRADAMRRERHYKAGSGHRHKQEIIERELKRFLSRDGDAL